MILLHQLFSHNMAAINFWLASCVVPDATRVYEGRLGTSAWHLADSCNGFTVGFSGVGCKAQQAQELDLVGFL
jgi:hypothetical protein